MATSKLHMAETFRQLGDLVTYRKRLQEIVDKYYAAPSYRNVKRWLAERK